MKSYKLLGIAGLPRSGKDTLADLLMESGYYGVSFGDIVRQEAFSRHADKADPISVEHMTETSNYLRDTYGPDVILKKALELFESQSIEQYEGLVLYSIRAPVEADFILSRQGRLVWVEASDEVRYKRALEFSREGEMKDIDLDTFLAHEALQWQPKPGLPAEVQMNVSYVRKQATDVLENNYETVDAFKAAALKFIETA